MLTYHINPERDVQRLLTLEYVITRQLPMGAGYCPWGGHTDWNGCNIHGEVHLALRDSAMRGVPLHVYNIHFSQCDHPMGSSRPPWAAGE